MCTPGVVQMYVTFALLAVLHESQYAHIHFRSLYRLSTIYVTRVRNYVSGPPHFSVLQATKSGVWDWERGYFNIPPLIHMHHSQLSPAELDFLTTHSSAALTAFEAVPQKSGASEKVLAMADSQVERAQK